MSLRIRFRFEGKCSQHPRYDPNRDGRLGHGNCEGCESLYVIDLYVRIAKRRADQGKGMLVRTVGSDGVCRNGPSCDQSQRVHRTNLEESRWNPTKQTRKAYLLSRWLRKRRCLPNATNSHKSASPS